MATKKAQAFMDKLNQHFVDAGFPSLKVTAARSETCHVTWYPYDYTNPNGYYGEPVSKKVPGFACQISHNGEVLINQHHIWIRENDAKDGFTMIQSAWCQRISHWSKHKEGVVDQRYDIWPIVDWITGPYAEENGINFKEAPAVFMGQKRRVSRDKKRNAIKKLKNRLKKNKGKK